MQILLYVPHGSEHRHTIQRVVARVFPDEQVICLNTPLSLLMKLQNRVFDIGIVILAVNRESLADFLSARWFFENLRVILIMLETDKKTLNQAFNLLPRFVGDIDNLNIVEAVLKKMYEKLYADGEMGYLSRDHGHRSRIVKTIH